MARRLSMAFLVAICIATLIQSSTAQTNHVVGDATGWTIPSNSAFYSNWAANQTFAVGDTLVFNFLNTQHNVARVSKADYDACTTANPISLATTSPARINIPAAGAHYFICNFTNHCAIGQKLTINVSAATSAPAPQPSTSSSPAPQPSSSSSSTPAPRPASTPSPVSAPSPAPVSSPPPSTSSAPSPGSGAAPTPGSSTTPSPPTTPSSPSPSGDNAPPSPDSSARSLRVAGLSLTLLSIVGAFLY